MSKPPSRPRRLHRAPIAALALAGSAGVAVPVQAAVPPARVALQARVEAVRTALAEADPEPDAVHDVAPVADVSAMGWLVAQTTNWTNWPKWSKWSNWANK